MMQQEEKENMFTIQTGGGDTNLSVRLDTVLQAVELPAGITDLDTALSEVQRLRAKWKDSSDFVLQDIIYTLDDKQEWVTKTRSIDLR